MSHGPRRLIEDPEWGVAFEGLLDEQGAIEGLPDDVRADVAVMVAASVAGAVGVAAVGTAAASMASASGSAATTGAVSTAVGGGSVSAIAGASGAAAGVSGGVASTVGASVVAGGFGAASASLAALGVVPKVIVALSLAGALSAGGLVAVKSTQNRELPSSTTSISDEAPHGMRADPARSSQGRRTGVPGDLVGDSLEEESQTRSGAEVQKDLAESAGKEAAEQAPGASLRDRPSPEAQQQQAAAAGGLAGEVSLLRRARLALSVNREYAWTLLNEYQRRYPEGALRSEYEALVRRAQSAQFDASSPSSD